MATIILSGSDKQNDWAQKIADNWMAAKENGKKGGRPRKIASIDCGCEANCGGRINIFWTGKELLARDPHGAENIIEQAYNRKGLKDALEDLRAMYDNGSWNLELVEAK